MSEAIRRTPESPRIQEAVDVSAYRYSHALSRLLLSGHLDHTKPVESSVGDSLSYEVVKRMEDGSRKNREDYWKEAPHPTFGDQMVAWLGNETSGIAQWVGAAEKDSDLQVVLQTVGLAEMPGMTPEIVRGHVSGLIDAINQTATTPLDVNTLSNEQVYALNFYQTYLLPHEDHNGHPVGTNGFIEDLANGVVLGTFFEDEHDAMEKAMERLGKISPLLQVMGDEAQHTVGAAVVASLHGKYERGKVEKAEFSENTPLKRHEARVLAFLTNQQIPPEETQVFDASEMLQADEGITPPLPSDETDEEFGPRDASSQTNTALPPVAPVEGGLEDTASDNEIATSLPALLETVSEPSQKEGNPYWIAEVPSAERIAQLAQEIGYDELKLTVPTYEITNTATSEGGINPSLFPPDRVLADNACYQAVKVMLSDTKGENGLFEPGYMLAVAASSVENPEAQSNLYLGLAREVLSMHAQHPELFGEFLQAQMGSPSQTFLAEREGRVADKEWQERQKRFAQDRYGVEDFSDVPEDKALEALQLLGQELHLFNHSLSSDARLLALTLEESIQGGQARLQHTTIDVEATLIGWEGRVEKLQEALSSDNPLLTKDQIRQIEFLSHSVNVTKIVERLHHETAGSEEVLEKQEGAERPALRSKEEALAAFGKTNREIEKRETAVKVAEEQGIIYQQRRLAYLRALLIEEMPDEVRHELLSEAFNSAFLQERPEYYVTHDREKMENPNAYLEFDAGFQSDLATVSGRTFFHRPLAALSQAECEALQTLFQVSAAEKMPNVFLSGLQFLGVPNAAREKTLERLKTEGIGTLLDLQVRNGDEKVGFTENQKEFMVTLLAKFPTEADQLMAVLYYLTIVWTKANNKTIPKTNFLSGLQEDAKRIQEVLGGVDELEYFSQPHTQATSEDSSNTQQ